MGFKDIKLREWVLISIAGAVLLFTMLASHRAVNKEMPEDQMSIPVLPAPIALTPAGPAPAVKTFDDDEDVQKEMKGQMDRDRVQQRQIKTLKMQLEQVNLQLDNEKALTEINKLKKENTGYVKDSNSSGANGCPSVRVIFLGGTDSEREAILSIDGTSYSVRAKDRPVLNVEILSVTDKGVLVHFSGPKAMTAEVNYVPE